MLNQEEKEKIIQNTWVRFNSNIGALHALFEKLPLLADNLDKARIDEVAAELSFISKESTESARKDIAAFLPTIDDLDVYPDLRKDIVVKEIINEIKDTMFKEEMSAWEQKHPHRSVRFVRLLSSVFNAPPMNGVLIRRSMLVSLVTFLEIFLEDLFKTNYLMGDASKEEAEKLASKLMKTDWRGKLLNLGKVNLHIPATYKYLEEIFEITQRRNLLVHNDGVVDAGYQKHIPNKYDQGDQLLVSTRYFQRAINIFHTLGFLLFHNQWVKNNGDLQAHYRVLDDLVLTSLEQKRYGLILELSENFESLELTKERQQVLLVNRAIAFREIKKYEKVEEIVSILAEDPFDWKIELAISMLGNNVFALKSQLARAQNKKGFIQISHWPLFDPVKGELWFKMAFRIKNKANMRPKNKGRK